jgi:FERM central domain
MEKTTQKENKNRDLYSVQYSSLEKDTIKHVKLRVYLLDNEFKTIYIEADSKVVNVLEILSIKMGIEDIENFGIFEQWENNGKLEEKLLKNEDPLPGSKARKSERKLILKCKLFRELNIINSNEQSAHLYYIQTKSNILTGYFYTDINNAVSLAAIQMQIEFGTYCPEKHKLGFMQTRIRDFVCNRLLEIKGGKHMEGLILQAFSQRDPVIIT